MSFNDTNSIGNSVSDLNAEAGYGPIVSHLMQERSEERRRVLLRALVHAIEQKGDVYVDDLSRHGLRGNINISLTVGQRVFVSLDDVTHCSGTVRWAQGHRFGMNFDVPLPVMPSNLETDAGTKPGHQERTTRMRTNFVGKIYICSPPHLAKIRNVSKSGMMVETDMPLDTDQRLLVSLVNGSIMTAEVRWATNARIGVRLFSPVSVLQFTYGDLSQLA